MKRKQFIDEVSSVLKEEKESTNLEVDLLGKELFEKIFNLNFFHVIVYILFLIASILLFHKIDHLSFISEDSYLDLLVVFVGISTLIAVIFFILYIYIKKKKKLVSRNWLSNTYKFYQIYDLFSFITIFITVFLWSVIFLVTPVEVSGDSMEATFHDGDKILVWHIGYESQKDDVVIIDAADYLGTEFIIKRVVATSGDKVIYDSINQTVSINGTIILKGISLSEYQLLLTDRRNNEFYYEDGIIPEGYSIVLGDNRGNSTDSRVLGLIKNEHILGKFIFRIYPLSKIGVPSKKN